MAIDLLYSEQKKFIFVAVPKTGTTSIQRRLLAIDPNLRRNQVKDEKGNWINVPTHATASQIVQAMGRSADDITFIAFLRDPYDILVSKYYFYRRGRVARKQGLSRRKSGEKTKLNLPRILRVLSAKILPLPIWARFYPFKSSASFITDQTGQIAVHQVGLTNRLQEDMQRIFLPFGYTEQQLKLEITNRTDYTKGTTRSPAIEAVLTSRLSEDLELFNYFNSRQK